jgi:ComEC/Rec2-related protein
VLLNLTPLVTILWALVGFLLSFVERKFLLLTVASLSALNSAFMVPMKPMDQGRALSFSGVVIAEDYHQNYVRLSILIDNALLQQDTVDYKIPVEFHTYAKETLLGTKIIIKGRIKPSTFLHRPHIFVGDIVEKGHPQTFFDLISHTVRNYIDYRLQSAFDDVHYNIASGLILGGSNRLGRELKDVFSRAGVLHILAVSGLHVGFVCLFISCILFFIPLSPKIKFVIVMIVLSIYAGVVGFRPSIYRATLMAFFFGLAIILQRNVNGIHVINITAIALLLINPLLLFDVGAQLSFAAVYGIVFLYPRISTYVKEKVTNKFLKFIYASIAISFSAQLFVSPFLIYYFHRLPTLATFSNLIIVPIATIVIFLLFIYLLLGLIFSALAKVIALPILFLISLLVSVSKVVAYIPHSTISAHSSPFFLITIFFLFPKRTRKCGIFVLLIMAIITSTSLLSDTAVLRITREGTYISTTAGETIYITSGEKTKFLSMNGINEVDYLVAPRRFFPVRKEFFTLPEKLHHKKIELGDMTINLQTEQNISCGTVELNMSDYTTDENSIFYVITDGDTVYEFRGPLYKSIIDQATVDIKILFARLILLL